MAAPTKRTRASVEADDAEHDAVAHSDASDATATPATPAATPRRTVTRRSPSRRTATPTRGRANTHTPTATDNTSAHTPTRTTTPRAAQTPTREAGAPPTPGTTRPARTPARARVSLGSSASASPSPRPVLTRSTSLLATARANTNATAGTPAPSISGGGGGGVRILTRAASLSATPLAARESLKDVSGGGSAPTPGKGGDEPGPSGSGGRRFGKGKENIPPAKDPEPAPVPEGSRKRVRRSLSGRASSSRPTAGPSRDRSASTASVRSESIGLSAPTPFEGGASCRTSSCLPSPSPTPSTARIQSPEDMEVMDVDDTPTRGKGKGKQLLAPPPVILTPPPSSPPVEEIVDGVDGINVAARSPSVESDASGTPTFANPYRALKAALRLSSAPAGAGNVGTTIVGRDDEKAILSSYISLVSSSDVGLYISGPPGTGKTALTTAVGRDLAAQGWKVAEVGVMGLRAQDVWSRLGEQLGCGKTEDEVVTHLGSGGRTFILLDEVDSLLPPPPALPSPAVSHVLSKLFSLPLISGTSASSTVKLVAISNTLDLTVRANLVLADGAMPQVLPFRAYNAVDMAKIVTARLAQFDTPDAAKVDPRAADLLCRKVEAQNGDLRMCLGVLSAAVGLAEAEWVKKTAAAGSAASSTSTPTTATTPPPTPLVKVALPHVLKAFTSHTTLRAAAGSSRCAPTSATGQKIRSVPLQGRMVLVSLLVFLLRSRASLAVYPGGAVGEPLTVSALYATYVHLLSHDRSPFPPAPESDYRDLVSNLETLGLVALAHPDARRRGGHHPRVELCVREDEVRDGLGLTTDAKERGRAEEEVAVVYAREQDRVERARARAVAAIERAKDGMGVDM